MTWFPMEMAKRNGRLFIWLRRIMHVGGGNSPRYTYTIQPLMREGSDEEGNGGYWRNAATSIPDTTVDLSRGWWCYELPLDREGNLKLPDDFYTARLPGQEL